MVDGRMEVARVQDGLIPFDFSSPAAPETRKSFGVDFTRITASIA